MSGTPKPTATASTRQHQTFRRVCATCCTWNPLLMECRAARGEACPPDACCPGWAKSSRQDNWVKNYGQSPNAVGSVTDPDHGQIGPGHVCKHGVRWPHPCNPCDDAAWAHHNCASPTEHAPSTSDGLGHRSSEG
jgi:hypothetical protein